MKTYNTTNTGRRITSLEEYRKQLDEEIEGVKMRMEELKKASKPEKITFSTLIYILRIASVIKIRVH